ncbi:hypothetical protein OG563_18045 [Nocardia vinacea]|uniref:Uncharacterized protein n=1 Tax=Nocardia vinacea TaxID=96468 RepID=A0ABZ1Z3P8_9NOCA|nr:hypothetical protein [Nocardia vinacea]
MNSEWIIAFSRADLELLDVMKEAVPLPGRRYDGKNQLWQITASARVMADLCTTFEQLGAAVAKPDALIRRRPDGGDHGSAEDWEKRFRAMEEAARWQHERIQQLEGERDDLAEKLKTATTQSTATNGWAEMLFAAVGPALSESVFKALTKCLHPDVSGADRTLQQQLNAARDRMRR